MQKIKYVFVVLTYRNTKDLEEFIASAKENVSDYQIIVVNSYFDDKSKFMIEKIAKENLCDFINVPNKGYSFGNNRGIEYANDHYDYEFLIVSNPDIIIREFPDITDYKDGAILLGADITNARQKKQNPLAPWRNRISEKILYDAFRKESKIRFLIGVALNRFFRELFLLIEKIKRKKSAVYALHGSFVIFSRKAIKLLGLPYDENMFLFAEESVLAIKAKQLKIPSYLFKEIKVFHKEDGSMNFESNKVNQNLKDANIYFYEHYCKKKRGSIS